jgi:hypothetical protein
MTADPGSGSDSFGLFHVGSKAVSGTFASGTSSCPSVAFPASAFLSSLSLIYLIS